MLKIWPALLSLTLTLTLTPTLTLTQTLNPTLTLTLTPTPTPTPNLGCRELGQHVSQSPIDRMRQAKSGDEKVVMGLPVVGRG